MVNMMKMMKQAAAMQSNMQKVQEELAEKTVEFSSGGGMVTAVVKGDLSLQSLNINPDCVDPEDVEMLEDLVVAAVDGAMNAAREMAAEEMGKVTQGMGLPPGMKLPF